jgi:hypothetical protein
MMKAGWRFSVWIVASALLPVRADACSKGAFMSAVEPRNWAYVLATATTDTMLAGAGGIQSVNASGHFGPTVNRAIYGQVLSVHRAGGAAPAAATRAVIVPWDYAADCRPVAWGNSAVWRPAGTSGVWRAYLRDSAHWAGGIPTYDVHNPSPEPYPGVGTAPSIWAAADSVLTSAQVFTLFDLMPRIDRSDNVAATLVPLLSWARQNQTLAGRHPAVRIIMNATYHVRTFNLSTITSPFTGTYRIAVTIAGQPEQSFFVRTYSRPVDEWDRAPDTSAARSELTYVRPITGYTLMISTSPTNTWGARAIDRDSYWYLPVMPDSSAGPTRVWSGEIQTDFILREVQRTEVRDAVRTLGAMIPARALLTTGGGASIEHRSVLKDGRTIAIRAERISGETRAW